MFYTLAQARSQMGPFVDNGTCDTTRIDARINEALERLLDQQDWECLKRAVRITSCNNTFALPYNAEKILWCDIDGSPANVYGQAYQYLSSGPGDSMYASTAGRFKDLADLGDHWPVMYDIPKVLELGDLSTLEVSGLRVCAFSTSASDVTKSLKLQGLGPAGEAVLGGETIPIQRWAEGVEGQLYGTWDKSLKLSANLFAEILGVSKTATSGYVCLYAVNPATSHMFLLAKYHPSQLLPQFRRYRITNTLTGYASSVLALVRLRHIPLSDPDDILPVDSLQALKLAIMSISAENAKDFATAGATLNAALASMSKREEAKTMTRGTPVVLDISHRTSLGRRLNGRQLL